jgi:hypothetical protein
VVNLFAFNATTREFIGSATLGYSDIRFWEVAEGHLYAGMGNEVVRWVGDVGDPFEFVTVGIIPSPGPAESSTAYLAYHKEEGATHGRIFTNTFGGGLYVSPEIAPGGQLETTDADQWELVFHQGMYDPEPICAATSVAGAVKSFDGWLYWGTMQVPGIAAMVASSPNGYGPAAAADELMLIVGTWRPITIFRGRNLHLPSPMVMGSPNPAPGPYNEVELLYGNPELYAFQFTAPPIPPSPGAGEWVRKPNNMASMGWSPDPVYGAAGVGNVFNNYTWSMAVYNDELFVGTMDNSHLLLPMLSGAGFDGLDIPWFTDPIMDMLGDSRVDLLKDFLEGDYEELMALLGVQSRVHYGGDLYRFPSSSEPAVAESLYGMGNYSSYGIRNMIADDEALYLGMANPMNLMTDLTDDEPEGGWELLRLRQARPWWRGCGRGAELALLLPPVMWLWRSRRRVMV